ncbi:unnamed protein product, partial [Ixodes hexagonus]
VACLAASTGYGYLVCTVGTDAEFPEQYPVTRGLCDLIVYTHVVAAGGKFASTTGRRSYETFLSVAKRYKSSKHAMFGISMSPAQLTTALASTDHGGKDFADAAEQAYNESGIGSYGTLGLPRNVSSFKFDQPLKNWYESLTAAAQGFSTTSLVFLGLKIQDEGKKISTDTSLANDLFTTLKEMKITLFVLITHNVESQSGADCAFVPISSMTDAAYKDKTLPALVRYTNRTSL